MVADLLGTDPAETEVLDSRADEVDYDLPAITTAGRYWVRGRRGAAAATSAFRLFVKHVQSWSRHPFFQLVPPEHREQAAASVPWRTEARRLPLGPRASDCPRACRMPRALGVFDLDEQSNAVWLEVVPVVDREWDLRPLRARRRVSSARFATDPRVMETSGEIGHDMTIHNYLEGRLSPAGAAAAPGRRDSGSTPWSPARSTTSCTAGCSRPPTRRRRTPRSSRGMPHVAAHGDACPNNLLVDGGRRRLRADRLRVLRPGADRVRPRPAARRRRPGRATQRRRPRRRRRRRSSPATWRDCAPRSAGSPTTSYDAPTHCS